MPLLFGVLFHFIGGFASGSFYIPYRKVKLWAWESYWITGGLFSWLIIPMVAALITIPSLFTLLHTASQHTLLTTAFLGALWGIGGLTFGLSMRYLGLSLGMAVAIGFTSAFGSLIPPIYRDLVSHKKLHSMSSMIASGSGQLVLAGVAVCVAGILLCGLAGLQKEKELTTEAKTKNIKEFQLGKGLLIASISGMLSACFNFGIEFGKPLAHAALEAGCNPLFQNNISFVVILWGGLITNLCYCVIMNYRNRTFGDYTNTKAPLVNNYLFSAAAGTIWFLQFFFYGMGESRLGNGASSWILHMAFVILVSNMWGIMFHEWQGVSKKTIALITAGIITVIVSTILVGLGNAAATA